MSENQKTELPRYKSHKKVWTLKIAEIEYPDGGGAVITPAEIGYDPFPVSEDYVDKHNPQVGGYWVKYDDGYESWSPAKAFEDGYSRCSG